MKIQTEPVEKDLGSWLDHIFSNIQPRINLVQLYG